LRNGRHRVGLWHVNHSECPAAGCNPRQVKRPNRATGSPLTE
jgi:hypothetical protein